MLYNPVLLAVQYYKLTCRVFHIISIDKSLRIEYHFPAIGQKQPAGVFVVENSQIYANNTITQIHLKWYNQSTRKHNIVEDKTS